MSCFPFTTKELGNSVFPGMNRLHLPALEPVKTEPAMSLAELCTHCDWPKLLAMSSPLANNKKKNVYSEPRNWQSPHFNYYIIDLNFTSARLLHPQLAASPAPYSVLNKGQT